jgi:hypothetical protein
MPATYLDPITDRPHPLLSTQEHSDFSRNFRELQKHAKRLYSLTRVLRSYCRTPPKLDGFEAEVDQELRDQKLGKNAVPTGVTEIFEGQRHLKSKRLSIPPFQY